MNSLWNDGWPGWRALVRTAGVAFFAASAMLAPVKAPRVRAQSQETSQAALPSFEVASIKLDRTESGHTSIGFRPGRFNTVGTSAKSLIKYAYDLKSDAQLSGRPSWVNSDKYDIEAKIDDALTDKLLKLPVQERADQVRLMLRSLLADRFKLKTSHATKELPIYAFVVAKRGPKLTPAATKAGKDSRDISSRVNGSTGNLVAQTQPSISS